MKKRILSALLALCMVFALGTVGAMATDEPVATTTETDPEPAEQPSTEQDETNSEAYIGSKYYATLEEAVEAVNNGTADGSTIVLCKDVEVELNDVPNEGASIQITKDMIIDGTNHTIKAVGEPTGGTDAHVISVTGNDVNVTLRYLKIDGSNIAQHGINVWAGNNADDIHVTLTNVTSSNNKGYGVCIGGADVTATNLIAHGNDWGGVNVDTKNGNNASFDLDGSDTDLTGNGATTAAAGDNKVLKASVVIESDAGTTTTTTLKAGKYDAVYTHNDSSASLGNDTLTITGGEYDSVASFGSNDNDSVSISNATINRVAKVNANTSFNVNNSTVKQEVTNIVEGSESIPVDSSNSSINYDNVSNGSGGNVSNTVASIGNVNYTSLDAAIRAANNSSAEGPIIIDLKENTTLENISYTLSKDITIRGNGHTVGVTIAAGEYTKAFTITDSTFTLDNVIMTIEGTGNSTSYAGTAFDVRNDNAELKLTGNTNLTLKNLESAIVFADTNTPASNEEQIGALTMDGDSTLTITTIDGNVSNGGVWNINGSDITVNGCGSHALSTEKFVTTGTTNISVSNANMFALFGSVIDLGDNTTLTVTNCGSSLNGQTTYDDAGYWSPVQVKSKENSLVGGPKMTVDDNVTVTTTSIFIPKNATYTSTGTVNAEIKTPEVDEGETPSIFVVTYVSKGQTVKTYTVNSGVGYVVLNPDDVGAETVNFTGWKVNDTTTYQPGNVITLTDDIVFEAVYTVPEKPTHTVTIGSIANGGASANPAQAIAGTPITITLTPNEGYRVSSVTTNPTTQVTVNGNRATFTMPDADVTVTVTFTATTTPAEEHRVNVYDPSNDHGNFYVSPTTQVQGEYVYIYTSPDRGYTVDRITITNHTTNSTFSPSSVSNSENTYRFRMPDSEVTVRVYFKLDNEFDINLSYNRNYGSVTARVDGDVTYVAQEYDKVYIYTEPNKGYMVKDITVSIDAWDEVEVELEREGVYSFRMPDADVEVEVTFAPGYEITIDDDIRYGEITTDPEDYAAEDDTVEVYFKPSNGYKLKTIEVFTGKDFDDEVTVRLHSSGDYYRFTMPDGDVYITAEFERTTMPFTDVRTTDWYYDEVLYVYNNGLMEGVSSYSFNPSGTMTREMFWAVLGRIDGQSITGTNWASQARSWAMNEGVSDGTNPTSLITREEMVTMLWRYAGSRAASGGLSRFNDASTISSWASTAMSWAVKNGIIDGVTSNTIQPRGTADRAQCAAIFMRYDQM